LGIIRENFIALLLHDKQVEEWEQVAMDNFKSLPDLSD
jgi:hypothetical protein